MCGIHFVINTGPYGSRTDDYFKDAFIANQLRGMHSSGMFLLEKDGTFSFDKKAVCGQEFLNEAKVKEMIGKVPRARVAVGHVRHATAGGIKDENAHPFVVSREDGTYLVGVHNGTLSGWKQKDGADGIDVDSEWAFTMLAERGIDAFRYFNGAFAFIWYDSAQPDVIHMARNSQRPMHYLITKDRKTMVGASELGMLGWLAERQRIELADKPEDRFFYTRPDKIYHFSLTDLSKFEMEDTPKYDPATAPPAPPTVLYPQRSSNHNYYHDAYLGRSGMHPYAGYMEDEPWDENGVPFGWRAPSSIEKASTVALTEVKAALKRARTANDALARNGSSGTEIAIVQDQEDLDNFERAVTAVVNNWNEGRQNEPKLPKRTVFLSLPNDRSATRDEIVKVKNLQLYGAVVSFSGIMYDEDTSIGMGTITWVDHTGKTQEGEAEVRNLPKSYFTERYVNALSPAAMVVVGYNENEDNRPCPPFYVLSELRAGDRDLLQARINKRAVS